ncbi:MAG: hypothetical protein KF760_28925 [Candidatus Eremiobacteraeota bacterium]|nr:hypothetical protein [Candidatus Eremiobacteraeota bacterium]MCW5866003.1 hypothetical protein [Candidatus Eremiobacteraeota bacterium]
MSNSIGQTPLKGIPFAHPAKSKPVHLKEELSESEEGGRVFTQDVGIDRSNDPDKGLMDWIFGPKQQEKPTLAEPMQFKLGNASLAGHLASDLKHAQYPSSHYEIRTFMPAGDGQIASVNFEQLLAATRIPSPPSQHYVVTDKQVQQAISDTGAAREQQLKNGAVPGDRVVPKDATLNPTDVTMYLRSTGDVSTRYAQQLSKVGQIEGFHVVAGIGGSAGSFQSTLKGYENISLMEIPHGEVWTEDYSEPSLGKGQITPAIFSDSYSGGLIHEAITEGRKQRYKGTGLDGKYAYHGAVNQGKYQQAALARGTVTQGPLRQALSYMEGGNIYTGTRQNGEGYVLVGKDSFHVTKKLLEKQTGKEWSEAEIKNVIAADLGLEAKNVVPIEQPGAFHLDMRLTAVAPGEIMLNDSKAACEQQLTWAREAVAEALKNGEINQKQADKQLAKIEDRAAGMREQAAKMAPYEEMTANDLKAAGFTVHRVGGSFVDPTNPGRDTANYFNARHFTNEQGERISVLMGGQAHEEAFMAQKIFDMAHGTISRIHFLDPSVTQKTLDLWGGLKCRTKPEGDLISGELLQNPAHAQLQQA